MHKRLRTTGRLTATLAAAALALTACASDDLAAEGEGSDSPSASGGGPLTIATQNFPEANLVTAMYDALLTDAGFDVTVNAVDTRDVYMSEIPGDVQVVPEYVGGVVDFLSDGTEVAAADTDEALAQAEPLLEEKGVTFLEPSEATSQNAYFVTQEFSEAEGVTTLSDLEGESVVLAAAPDCTDRPDCEGGLTDTYGIDVTELLPLGYASPQTYEAVISGEAQVGQTGTLDGTLEEQGLVLLEDDRGIQPAQNLVPMVSTEFLEANPAVQEPLEQLMAALDNETLAELLVRVSVDRETPEAVAEDFLTQEGLL